MKKFIENYGNIIMVLTVLITGIVIIIERHCYNKLQVDVFSKFKNQQTILFKQDSIANQLEIDYKKANLERLLR